MPSSSTPTAHPPPYGRPFIPIPKWKIEGIVDDFTECGCCGRRGLKRTVAMMPLDADGNEDGTAEDVVYYGTSCAATALSWTQGKVTDTARAAQAERNLTAFVQQQRDAQTAALSDLERREQAAAEREANAAQRETQAIARERAATRRAVLVGLGATGEDLADAERLLVVEDDADETAIAEAATALKTRRPELFGSSTAAVLPAAPGGSPAGGPPPRGANVPKPGQHGADMARQRGFLTGS
ncbi:hypothetical protein [Streptomyces sp. NPDC008240]|uniref:hypothetical protein n=1 Tax=Streptomyces sp. NPDC008240 TaxID=3364822 RepID=UPI0036EEE404